MNFNNSNKNLNLILVYLNNKINNIWTKFIWYYINKYQKKIIKLNKYKKIITKLKNKILNIGYKRYFKNKIYMGQGDIKLIIK